MSPRKKLTSIFALIEDGVGFHGYFKTTEDAIAYMDKESLNDCQVLEVTRVFDAIYPEEPEIELSPTTLESCL